jgi:hypothetical protein
VKGTNNQFNKGDYMTTQNTLIESIEAVSNEVEKTKIAEVMEKESVLIKYPVLRASEGPVISGEGILRKDYKEIRQENKVENLFSIVSTGYKLVQHEDVIKEVERTLDDLQLHYDSRLLQPNDGARIRMITTFPNISIKIGNDLFNMRLSWDNSYDQSTSLRLVLGVLSPLGYELALDSRLANFCHKHTKNLDLKKFKNTILNGIDVFKTKVEIEFRKMIETPLTMEKAINFLDNCITEKIIADTYLSTINFELKRMPKDELDSQWVLYNLINKVLFERVTSLDQRADYLRTMNNKLKNLK